MKWTSSDYDCRNLFINELEAILEERGSSGFSLFFHHVEEYLEISKKLSSEIITILNEAQKIKTNLPDDEILKKIKLIYMKFKKLKM